MGARAAGGGEVEYGGFWIRVAAALIDSVLASVVVLPLLIWVYGTGYIMDPILDALGGVRKPLSFLAFRGPADVLINYGLPTIALILFWIARQATPGKMMLSLKIVDAKTLGPLTPGQAIGRYLGYYVSILGACLGLLSVGWDPRKQGWHDKLAGTIVIQGK